MRARLLSIARSFVGALLLGSATAGPGDQGCAPDRQNPTPNVQQVPGPVTNEQIPTPNDPYINEGAQGRINSTVDENAKGQGWRGDVFR